MPAEGLVDLVAAFDMAGGADADFDDMLTGGLEAKLVIECRNRPKL